MTVYHFNPVTLIDEVKKRPGLYRPDHPADREEKLSLWKEIGAAIYKDWNNFSKATAYDRVLQLQRKWRSLRDAYNREVRARKTGVRVNRRVYMYFKRMSFLGGFDGTISDENEVECNDTVDTQTNMDDDPLFGGVNRRPRPKKRRAKKSSSDSNPPQEEVEVPMFPVEIAGDNEGDSDRLFLLSFLPEMRQLPLNIKMWARAQIANVMQEAVTCHYTNARPGTSNVEKNGIEIKRQRQDSSE